jgi:hypothetical protein
VFQQPRDLIQILSKVDLPAKRECPPPRVVQCIVIQNAAATFRSRSPDSAKAFGAAVADEIVSARPEAYIATMSKAKPAGKIFIDYFRNDYTATAIADYGVRARPGAPVAVPWHGTN